MRPVWPCSARWEKYLRRPSGRRVQAVQWARVVMEEGCRPASRSWRRLASQRSMCSWGVGLWAGRTSEKSLGA